MKNSKEQILSGAKHLLIIAVLAIAFWPFVKSYLFASAPSGNDYYVGLIYAEFFRKYLTWPPAGWEHFWFSGTPVVKVYPWLHFYLMQPLVSLLGSDWGMEIYLVVALFLFFVFSYLLFWELSRNRVLSLLLGLVLLNSRGVFNALPYNGFIAAAATQMFLPMVAYLIVRSYHSGNKRFLLAAGLLTGLAILGHPPTGAISILIPGLSILFFWQDETISLWSREKVKVCLIFGLVAMLVASTILYPLGEYFLNKTSSGRCQELTCWGDIPFLVRQLNLLFYILVAILAGTGLALRFFKKGIDFRLGLTFLVPLAYLIAFLAAEKLDLLSTVSQVMWPERIIWAVALLSGAVAAAFFGGLRPELEPMEAKGRRRYPQVISRVVLSGMVLLLLLGWPKWLVLDFASLSSPVGAYPSDSYLWAVDKYQETDVATVLPTWLEKDDLNYRFDSLLYTMNFWWNSAVEVPSTRGYVHYLRQNQSFWYSWLTAGMTDRWGEGILRPTAISQNTARFLIDWYAIRYLEDSNRKLLIDNPYADFILEEPISDRKEQVGELLFYRLAEDQTSPIVKASNAKAMLVVGLKDAYVYDNLMKVLAAENLNSRVLIPIRGPGNLDELNGYNLNDFDVIFLNDYRYEKFQSWDALADYVRNGGKLIIETGTQVRESDSITLPEGITQFPEVFPVKATKRESLGIELELTTADHPVLDGINVSGFGPFLYEGTPWKLSFVPDKTSLKEGARVLLRQRGYPILATWKLGEGEVIWSGLNLPYHFKYYDRPAEAKLFANMLSFLLGDLSSGEVDFSFERKRPEEIRIMGRNFSGVVFKEHFDSGWRARVNGNKVRIYPAGPDFMYTRVPEDLRGDVEVEFSYRGSTLAWFFFFLGLGTIGLTVWYPITGRGLGSSFLVSAKKKIDDWWTREEE